MAVEIEDVPAEIRELLTPTPEAAAASSAAFEASNAPPQAVQDAEAALLAKIAGLEDAADVTEYTKEYNRPDNDTYDGALDSEFGPKFEQQAGQISQMAPDGIPVPAGIPNVIQALYAGSVFGRSPVDAEKDAYFTELLKWHAEVTGCAMYQGSDIENFLCFLFKKRTLLAASLINRNM